MVSKVSDDILGISESYFRLKKGKDANDNMDTLIDTLLTWEDKENISKSLKEMRRKNLEKLVLKKVVEGIMNQSESGKNSIKILELQAQKEKLFSRVGSLENKVQELTKALSRILDMQSKNPSNLFNNRKLNPIRYYRSVGRQVNVDQQLKLNGYNKVIQSHNPTLQVNGSNTNTTLNRLTNGHAGNTGNQIINYATNPQTAVVKNSPVMKSPPEIARTPIAARNSATAKCVDLTSEVTQTQSAPNIPTVVTIPNRNRVQYSAGISSNPLSIKGQILKEMPSKPDLILNSQPEGIYLSWTLPITARHADIEYYQIYVCQKQITISPGKMSSWRKVGDVKALPLPMACTISQCTQGNRYFFIVRAIDVHGRTGSFSDPKQIVL